MKLIPGILLLLPVLLCGAETLKKTAVLYLPEQIECESGGGMNLPAEVGFRWDEAESLSLSVWWNPTTGKEDNILGSIDVFDESGRELSYNIFMSLPPAPSKEVTVSKGELKRFKLFESAVNVIFPHPGNYYAIAKFSWARSGKRKVIFTTNRKWFTVIEAQPKNKTI